MRIPLKTPEGKLYKPRPTQERFHGSPCLNKAYLGGYGSGKTLSGAIEVLVSALENPGPGIGLVARYDWDELIHTTWQTLLDIIPPQLIVSVKQRPPEIRLKNGWTFRGYNLKRHQKLGSEKFSIAWLDEACDDGVEESIYLMLQGRMRHHIGPGRIIVTGNPGGHNWVYKFFFAHQFDHYAKKYDDHYGVRAATSENIYLSKQYLDRMKATYPEDWLERFFSGSFDVFEGQILDNFQPEIHVIDPFPIPWEWPRYRGLDHGYTHPTACVWIGQDFAGNYLAYRTYYKKCSVPAENASEILSLSEGEEDRVQWTAIDPSTRQHQSAGGVAERLIDQYRQAGLYCQEGNNDVKASIARLRGLLAPDERHEFPAWHPRAGQPGAPHLFFTRDCRELLWELPQWKWKDVKPGAVDREKPLAVNDDAIAALRYCIMRAPQQVEAAPPQDQWRRFLSIVTELEEESRDKPLIGAGRLG